MLVLPLLLLLLLLFVDRFHAQGEQCRFMDIPDRGGCLCQLQNGTTSCVSSFMGQLFGANNGPTTNFVDDVFSNNTFNVGCFSNLADSYKAHVAFQSFCRNCVGPCNIGSSLRCCRNMPITIALNVNMMVNYIFEKIFSLFNTSI